MTSLIVYPVIIVVAVALLIILFARALKTDEAQKAEAQIQGHVPMPAKKQNRVEDFLTRFKHKSVGMTSRLKKRAEKKQIEAALQEAQIEKTQKDQEQEQIKSDSVVTVSPEEAAEVPVERPVQAQQAPSDGAQKLSRMGEIILSYHKGTADGSMEMFHDEQEITLVQNVEENPKSALAYENLGDYYMERQRFDDARECYKYVLRVDPRHKKAQDAMRKLDRVLGVG